MPLYFLRISLEHLSFRIPELLSISKLFGFEIKFHCTDYDRGVIVIEVEKEEYIERILDRGVLVISASRLYAEADSYEELHTKLKTTPDVFTPDLDACFKVTIECVNNRPLDRRYRRVVEEFAWTGLRGRIDLKNPDVEFVCLEDYDLVTTHTKTARLERDGNFQRVYFGRRVGFSRARPVMNLMDVKQRTFFGNTSMEAEMGLLFAGQALPAPGKLIYDPFVGTGSLLYSTAYWGATVMGSDIDARQFRGKDKDPKAKPGILRSAAQYGVEDNFLDILAFDVTHGPWRRGGFIDAIVTDPPYGVRAGAKRLGKTETRKRALRDKPFQFEDGTFAHERPGYLPPSKPYELVDLTLDLVQLARYLLVPGGRLVFFLPTVNDDFEHVDVPVVEGMQEVKWEDGSLQDFGKWGRRLITMEKTATDDGPPPTFADHSELTEERLPGHHNFGRRYLEGFLPREGKEEEENSAEEGEAKKDQAAAAPAVDETTAGVAALSVGEDGGRV